MKLRSIIVAPPGKQLIQIDLSQAESWIVAYLSGDITMQTSLTSGDIHYNTAVELFNTTEITKPQRYTGKRCNHAFAYRMSAMRFVQIYNKDAADVGVSQIANKDGITFQTKWVRLYNAIPIWWSEIENTLGKTRTLITPYGRVRTFFGHWGQELFKQATAFLPQSTIADHFNGKVQRELGITGGMIEVWKKFNGYKDILLLNQSHDSLILECPTNLVQEVAHEATKLIRRPLIVNNQTVTIPTDCEVGESWGKLEKFKIQL